MIRIIGVAIVGAIIGSFLTDGSTIGVWAGLLFGAAIGIVPLAMGTSTLRCPFCRKRVKLGASACHHCGRSVGRDQVFPGGG